MRSRHNPEAAGDEFGRTILAIAGGCNLFFQGWFRPSRSARNRVVTAQKKRGTRAAEKEKDRRQACPFLLFAARRTHAAREVVVAHSVPRFRKTWMRPFRFAMAVELSVSYMITRSGRLSPFTSATVMS